MNLSDDKAFRKEHAVLIEKLAGNLTSLGLDINASRAKDAAVSQLKAVTRLFGIWHGVENPESPTMFDCERAGFLTRTATSTLSSFFLPCTLLIRRKELSFRSAYINTN